MSRKRFKGRISGPFVPLLKDTLKTPAWKALSYGARSLYIALKWRFNSNLENAVYVSVRMAGAEMGASRESVRFWFKELAHYGFIVMVRLPHHGVNGRGRAPHWRLTEEKYLGKESTREFLRWNGIPFTEKRTGGVFQKTKAETPRRGQSDTTAVPYVDSSGMEQVTPRRCHVPIQV